MPSRTITNPVLDAVKIIIDRSNNNIAFDCPYTSLAKINAPIFSETDIPLTLKKITAVKPGSRFLK